MCKDGWKAFIINIILLIVTGISIYWGLVWFEYEFNKNIKEDTVKVSIHSSYSVYASLGNHYCIVS